MEVKNRESKLYLNNPSQNWSGYNQTKWSHVTFEHPGTFDTLAMENEKKEEIKNDLTKFSNSQDYYKRIGKAWKRGYLLHGPPGTGKSTMVAAMANFLDYDVYDLELTTVKDNTELRRLLIETSGKSIIVIEDIDCSLDLTACGGERIIVFTTNFIDKLDPALIRKGRMDKHIEMSYCGFEAFKVLAMNYLYAEEEEHEAKETCLKRLIVALKEENEEAKKRVEEEEKKKEKEKDIKRKRRDDQREKKEDI
uniref:AAA+ ATPase domain-containing protein n=1 Tax=Brassica oleracea var. oleracea TaxID=109376 RepID=A0A0D3A8V8_BRAOL